MWSETFLVRQVENKDPCSSQLTNPGREAGSQKKIFRFVQFPYVTLSKTPHSLGFVSVRRIGRYVIHAHIPMVGTCIEKMKLGLILTYLLTYSMEQSPS